MQKLISLIFLILTAIVYNGYSQNEIFTEELIENIKSRVNNEVNTGIVIGVVTQKGTSFYSYGVKSLETKEPVDEYTVFEIGSISKTFTGILLANEVIKGELSLNTPLQELLPNDITAPTRNGESIKLVNLANHTSALPRRPNNFVKSNPANPYADLTIEQTYEFLNNYELPYDIGSKFSYSNLGMGLLGTVLAAKHQTDYEDLMVRQIANPLGMNDTRISLTTDMEKRLAKGHNLGMEVENWDLPAIAGAGAIRSTAVDMLKYLAANMSIEKSKLYPAMKLSHKYSGSKAGDMTVGLGWITSDVEGEEIIWHDGGTGGYMSFAGFTKCGEKGVVVLTNSTGFPDDIGFHILNPKSPLKNPKPSIATKLNRIVFDDGIETAVKTYARLKKNHANQYNFASSEMIKLGYNLLHNGKINESIEIFKINAEANPNDWNAFDSCAEALLKNNNKEKAIEYYKKSVKLNPENLSGIIALRKLGIEYSTKE